MEAVKPSRKISVVFSEHIISITCLDLNGSMKVTENRSFLRYGVTMNSNFFFSMIVDDYSP